MMLLPHLGLAISTFVVTNIDDLLLLSFYFSSGKFRHTSIVTGQYAGIVTLILISLAGLLAGQIMPDHWVSLLGLLPLLIGVKGLFDINEEDDRNRMTTSRRPLQFLQIALITIANGGDNIGVYAPLFGNIDPWLVPVYIGVFLVLTGFWCWLASVLSKYPHAKTVFTKYSHIILPVFLIILGLFILKDFVTWATGIF